MKCRILLLMSLFVTLIQGLAPAQTPDQEDQYGKAIRDRQTLLDHPLETKIFFLECTQADDMQAIVSTISQKARIAVAESSNALLITAPPDELETIRAAICALDAPEISKVKKSQPIMCRVYMIERLSTNQSWQSFSISLAVDDYASFNQIINNINTSRLYIKDFSQNNFLSGDKPYCSITIHGQALSSADVDQLTQMIPNSRIDKINWKDNSNPTSMAQVAPLPDSLQKHIERFLGKDTEIAAYWFGNLSIPGEVQAPIGPWGLELTMENLGAEGLIELNLGVTEVRVTDRGENIIWSVIHNSMQTKIGHPVIIGYTRDKDESPTTGALVVIPEPMPDLQ